MRVTWIAIAVVSAAGCKGGSKAKPKPVVYDAAPVAVELVDGGRPWYALPIDASPDAREYSFDTLPDLNAGVTGPVRLMMVDAPVGAIVSLLSAPRMLAVKVSDPTQRITGALSTEHSNDVLAVLAQSHQDQFPTPLTGAKGKGPDVELQFAAAPVRDLFRLFGDVERRNYVLPPGALPDLDVVASRVPSDAAAHAVATAAGLSAFDVHGNLTFVHDPAQPGLDPALVAKKGGVIELAAHNAHPGELYAALAALGVDPGGGAACGDGDPIDLRVKKVKGGVAIAAIAAASGVAPGPSVCTPGADAVNDFTEVHVIAHAGKHAVAVVSNGKAYGVLDSTTMPPDSIGADWVRGTMDVDIALYPDTTTTPATDPTAWVKDLPSARVAALLFDGNYRVALVEMADGSTHVIKDGTSYSEGMETYATLLDNTLTVSIYAGSGDVQATLKLRAK